MQMTASAPTPRPPLHAHTVPGTFSAILLAQSPCQVDEGQSIHLIAMRLIIKPEWEVKAPNPRARVNKCLHCRTSGAGHRLTTELLAATVVP